MTTIFAKERDGRRILLAVDGQPTDATFARDWRLDPRCISGSPITWGDLPVYSAETP